MTLVRRLPCLLWPLGLCVLLGTGGASPRGSALAGDPARWPIALGPAAPTRAVRSLALQAQWPLTHSGQARFLAWGPQGSSLLYSDGGRLWVADMRSRQRQRLTNGPVADAVFSGDGLSVLYRTVTPAGLPGSIIRVTRDGRTRRRLTGPDLQAVGARATTATSVALADSVLRDGRIALERAGRLVALDMRRGALASLGALTLPVVLPSMIPPAVAAIAPDGTRVAILSVTGELVVRAARTGRLVRRLVSAGGERVVGAGRLPATSASWSPDGHTLVYQLGGPGGVLKAVDMTSGRTWLLLRLNVETLSGVMWSPDGATLAFAAVPTGTGVTSLSEIMVLNTDGSGLHPLDPDAARPGWAVAHRPGQIDPRWAPRGHALGYTRVTAAPHGPTLERTDVWLATLSTAS